MLIVTHAKYDCRGGSHLNTAEESTLGPSRKELRSLCSLSELDTINNQAVSLIPKWGRDVSCLKVFTALAIGG